MSPILCPFSIRAGGLDGVGVTAKASGISKSGVTHFLYFCSLQSGILLDGTLVYFNVVIYSEETVLKKANRMFKGLQVLNMTQGFPEARLNQEWRANGWLELVIEDFHFAFELVDNVDGERIVVVRDAIHSLLYH